MLDLLFFFSPLLCLSLWNQFLQVAPFFMYIPGILEKAFQHQRDLLVYIRDELVKVHKETWDPSCRRDITDAFLEEMEKVRSVYSQSLGYDMLVMKYNLLVCHALEPTQQITGGCLLTLEDRTIPTIPRTFLK